MLAELIDDADGVFHLAASVGVRLIVESPVRTIENNVKGTEAVLEFAGKKKKKVLITSTSEVYGKSTKIPFTEEDDLVMGGTQKGRWSYACSKAIDEFLALAYWKERGLPVVIVRLFNTVGPRQTGRYGMVLPSFVRAALEGKPLTVYGDGTQSRCFCHVNDTVGALAKLIEHPQAVGEIFNVGSEEEISIGELAQLVKSMTQQRFADRIHSLRPGLRGGFRRHAASGAGHEQSQEPGGFPHHPRYAADRAKRHRLFQRGGKTAAHTQEVGAAAGGEGLARDIH